MITEIERLMEKHRLTGYTMNGAGRTRVEKSNNSFVITLGDLPNLTFYVELAKLAGIDLESIQTEAEENGGGCDTCGYGGGTEYVITVPTPSAERGAS